MSTHRYTQDELLAEALRRFGEDANDFAFVCPRCGDIATVRDFTEAGGRDAVGQICIGRILGDKRGCDWSANGLCTGPWTIVMHDGTEQYSFALAPATVCCTPEAPCEPSYAFAPRASA